MNNNLAANNTPVPVLSIGELLNAFETDGQQGISNKEASLRSVQFGLNINVSQKVKSIWQMFFEQFKSPIVYLLFVAAFASLYFKNSLEAIAIFIVILVNALIGFFMELQARSSMRALKEMDLSVSKVIRGGKTIEVLSEQLTPGDLLLLEAGDMVSGDGRVIESNGLQVDESALTGESFPILKTSDSQGVDTDASASVNMVYKGTAVMNGNGKVIITGIAANTELGKISELVGRSATTKSPLDIKIGNLTKKLIYITLFMTAFFALTAFIEGKPWLQILETSIALAVAAFPEGLPIVATVALAFGMLRMAKRDAIVKRLSSVETLGGVNVILTDKTGTLTENKIFVRVLSFPQEEVHVSMEKGHLVYDDMGINSSQKNFELLVKIGTLCNNAPGEQTEKSKISGDPIEIALLLLNKAAGFSGEESAAHYQRISEIPFSAETKLMATADQNGNDCFISVKGAVEGLILKCTHIQAGNSLNELTSIDRKKILANAETLSASGLRVLAFAFKSLNEIPEGDFIAELTYVGMVGFLDPPRGDIKGAIATCRTAGIKIVMITGDHPLTALSIAKQVGITEADDNQVILGNALPQEDLLDQQWRDKILSTTVFARTSPKQKLEIVDTYQKAGFLVAMTGDGVNDAPAIKKADVGIAMGLRGTQVAKETANIVLKDDSFVSITRAVANGREIFQNIQRFVIYLISCNLSEIIIVTLLGFFASGAILFPLQILFLNMVTDVFPALALGLGRGDKSIMLKAPRDPGLEIISNRNWLVILVYAVLMTLSVLLAIFICMRYVSEKVEVINNVAFITLAAAQLFHVFNMSSLHSGMMKNEVTKNKFVWMAILFCFSLIALVYVFPQSRQALNLNIIPLKAWLAAIFAGTLPLLLVQLYKLILGKNHQK
ncbi:cation-transporting P-type ATPase [Pedobacter psychrodurus]|uniref:Cation-transporting P-type ATPase n=1 Tax=Pedobacter psychrodurus TaxID=2530456 RepID=A0A4R0Q021_9SPHI|nr:cation-transporting P-type ATPase [Pedobacter psychrodurus]TCD23388.1 cation-transporting P-type ATPase [Pedobacter psychrodurus]